MKPVFLLVPVMVLASNSVAHGEVRLKKKDFMYELAKEIPLEFCKSGSVWKKTLPRAKRRKCKRIVMARYNKCKGKVGRKFPSKITLSQTQAIGARIGTCIGKPR